MLAFATRYLRARGEDMSLIYSLVRRDYALQYAGTLLGLAWLLLQYAFQVGLFFVIFGLLLPGGGRALGPRDVDYLLYLLGGMVVWLPLSEMLLRGCGILSENRQVVRRTTVGARLLLWVPVFEALVHYTILFVLVLGVGAFREAELLSRPGSVLAAFVFGCGALLFFGGWSFLLARVGIIFKDVSPLMRLVLQIAFWSTPIVYVAPAGLEQWFAYHPLHILVGLHRMLLFGPAFGGGADHLAMPLWNGLVAFFVISLPVFFLSGRDLHELVVDQL